MQAFLDTDLLVVTNGDVGHKDATCVRIRVNSPYAEHPLPWPTVASVQAHAGLLCACIPGFYDDEHDEVVEEALRGQREQPLRDWPHDVPLPVGWWIDFADENPYIFSADVDPQEIAAMHAANNDGDDGDDEDDEDDDDMYDDESSDDEYGFSDYE